MRKVLLLAIFVVAAIVAHAQIVDAEHATKPSDQTVFYQTPEIDKKKHIHSHFQNRTQAICLWRHKQ